MLLLGSVNMIPNRAEVVTACSKETMGGKSLDLKITRLMGIPTLGLLVLASLDQRWNMTPLLPLGIRLFGVLAFGFSYAMVLWAMYSNPFFSQVVRIQSERGHVAVTSGPYQFIRHPGYFGMTISLLGAVFLLEFTLGVHLFWAKFDIDRHSYHAGRSYLARRTSWLIRICITHKIPPYPWNMVIVLNPSFSG